MECCVRLRDREERKEARRNKETRGRGDEGRGGEETGRRRDQVTRRAENPRASSLLARVVHADRLLSFAPVCSRLLPFSPCRRGRQGVAKGSHNRTKYLVQARTVAESHKKAADTGIRVYVGGRTGSSQSQRIAFTLSQYSLVSVSRPAQTRRY